MGSLSTYTFSPNSDQHQISPLIINAYSTPEVMRIFPQYFSPVLLLEKFGNKKGEFAL